MLKRLSNRSEVFVNELLSAATTRHGAEIYRKVRIADVVAIDPFGPQLREFALKGHFDFVVCDRYHDPLFAVEFDGGGHDPKNDHLKDEICKQSGLALFRLTPQCSRVKIRDASFVAYLVHVWFYGQEFARMQAAGEIAYDEPFMMSGFLKPNAKNIFDSEFIYTPDAVCRLTRVLATGNPMEHLNAKSLTMMGPEGRYAAFAQHGDLFGRYYLDFRAISWGTLDPTLLAERELSEFCHALAYHDLCEEVEAARVDPRVARSAAEIAREISDLKSSGFRIVMGRNTPDSWL